jgi:signal transduction histidine kinase/ActR/RegA family two-component response regulator
MSQPVKVLLVSDAETDGQLLRSALALCGYLPEITRVRSMEGFRRALARDDFQAIVCELSLQKFSAREALKILEEEGHGASLIVLAEELGESALVEVMRAGASDVVLRSRSERLGTILTEQMESQRRQGSERIRRLAEASLSRIFESSADAFAVISRDRSDAYIYAAVNQTFIRELRDRGLTTPLERIIGGRVGDLLRHKWQMSPDNIDRFFHYLGRCFSEGRQLEYAQAVELADRTFEASFVLYPIISSSGRCQHVLVSMRNLSGQRKEGEANIETETDSDQAQKLEALGALAGGIAHDFNNILTCILGYTEICMRRLNPGHAAYDGLTQIFSASLRARDLVSQILTFGRKQPTEKRPVKLAGVAAEALKLLRSSTPPNVTIVSLLPQEGPMILADLNQLYQVIINLCTNAIQAMESAGGKMTLSVAVVSMNDPAIPLERRGGVFARLTVADTGSGMDKATLDRIFEPFFTTKKKGGGTGLGLSMVHGIVLGHHGFVRVESKPGKGSKFHVYLPVHEIERAGEPISASTTNGQGHGEKILVIDDDAEVARIAVAILKSCHYNARAMTDPQEAIEEVRNDPAAIDLVMTDLIMPGFSGPDVVHAVRSIRHDLPVLLMSGYASSLNEETAAKDGFSGLIHKPFEIHELSSRVAEVLAHTRRGGG